MRIAVDARTVTSGRTGIGQYTLRLLKEHARRSDAHRITAIVSRESRDHFSRSLQGEEKNLTVSTMPFTFEDHPMSEIWVHGIWPLQLRRWNIDVFHGAATVIPFISGGAAVVVTVHDLIPILFPRLVPKRYHLYMRYLLRLAAMRADRIIALSCATRDDLTRVYGVPGEKIDVIPHGVGEEFAPSPNEKALRAVKRKYGLKERYILFLGKIQPTKNVERLVAAFGGVERAVRRDCQLVLAGDPGAFKTSIVKAAEEHDISGQVTFTGYVSEADVPLLYAGAEIFILPSFYEGFGLPILEAMACGTPVITSNVSSMPEVAGDAAILVNPHDAAELSDAIQRLLKDDKLRRDLSEAGLRRVSLFSWRETSDRTLAVYERARSDLRSLKGRARA